MDVQDAQGNWVLSSRAPIGAVVSNLATTPSRWLDLVSPGAIDNDSTPVFQWKLQDQQGLPVGVDEINLFVSVFLKDEGLLPWDKVVNLDGDNGNEFLSQQGLDRDAQINLLSSEWSQSSHHKERDFNPNRIITATWKRNVGSSGGIWTWGNGERIGTTSDTPTSFDLSAFSDQEAAQKLRTLTAGQTYHWAVEAFKTGGGSNLKEGTFKEELLPVNTQVFSSVTVLTHGFTPPVGSAVAIPDRFYEMAGDVTSQGGLILRYDRPTGFWLAIDRYGNRLEGAPDPSGIGNNPALATAYQVDLQCFLLEDVSQKILKPAYRGKPLVLLPDWSKDRESAIPDSGFTEAAADAFFASLVQLDQWLGGKVGDERTGQIYDATGQLTREQGRVLNSPLHFIGFSRGTVVNSEIIQRLLTAFPHAGGVNDSDRDLQMTTIDPHDFNQPSLNNFGVISGVVPNYSDFHEPKVQVWKGITFADNYYQTVPQLDGNSLTPAGRDITNSSFMLGTPDYPC